MTRANEEREGIVPIERKKGEDGDSHKREWGGGVRGEEPFSKAKGREPIGRAQVDEILAEIDAEKHEGAGKAEVHGQQGNPDGHQVSSEVAGDSAQVGEKSESVPNHLDRATLSIVEAHVLSGKKIKNHDLAENFQKYIESYNPPKPSDKGLLKYPDEEFVKRFPDFKLAKNVEDLKSEYFFGKRSPDYFEGSKSEENKAFAEYIAVDFLDWLNRENPDWNKVTYFRIKDADLTDGEKVKVNKFVAVASSGKVTTVGFNVKKVGESEFIDGIGVRAVRIQDGNQFKDEARLDLPTFLKAFGGSFGYQKMDRQGDKKEKKPTGPVLGPAFTYSDGSFQFIVPSTPENSAKGILSRLRFNGRPLSDKNPPDFEVKFVRSGEKNKATEPIKSQETPSNSVFDLVLNETNVEKRHKNEHINEIFDALSDPVNLKKIEVVVENGAISHIWFEYPHDGVTMRRSLSKFTMHDVFPGLMYIGLSGKEIGLQYTTNDKKETVGLIPSGSDELARKFFSGLSIKGRPIKGEFDVAVTRK